MLKLQCRNADGRICRVIQILQSKKRLKDSMLIIKNKNKSQLDYLFSGDLSMLEVDDLYKALKEPDSNFKVHHFVIREVEHLDLSFFQLLFAYLKMLIKLHRKVTFDFQLEEEYNRIFQRSGLKGAFDQLLIE